MEKYLNIWKFLKNRFQFFKQKTALVCGSERISYAQLTEIVEQGGKQTFTELCRTAGIKVPFEDGALKDIADGAVRYLEK